jgi:hypothetical protein
MKVITAQSTGTVIVKGLLNPQSTYERSTMETIEDTSSAKYVTICNLDRYVVPRQNSSLRDSITSLITKGYTIIKLPIAAQKSVWTVLNEINLVSSLQKNDFSFPDITDGFLPQGGEHAKYTNNVDLCSRFCYWHKYRNNHSDKAFASTSLYQEILNCENQLCSISQDLIEGIWAFFHCGQIIKVRDTSYIQLCMYDNTHQDSTRKYLQDRHEDGHLITLIKPTRDGLVIFVDGKETPVHLADDELIVITGSLLTELSDGQIPPTYHAVRNPMMPVSRSSLVYFLIPDLTQEYKTLLSKKPINIAAHAEESHQAFGNAPLR